MMFASKAPRDLNRDPRPLSTIGTGRRVRVGSEYAGETVLNPRPEYDPPQHNEPNPLLLAFRDYCTDGSPDVVAWSAGLWLNLLDEPDCAFDATSIIKSTADAIPEERRGHALSHLYAVLLRLDALSEKEAPA